MNKYEELQKLEELRAQGIISDEEFEYEKHKILGSDNSSYDERRSGEGSDNGYIAVMHLSQFAGFILCGLGFIIPVIMWLSRSKESREIDIHGKNITNFMISMIIYTVILIPLCFLIVGIPLLILLIIFEFIFIIIATIKAANGE
ncbi:MAG: DUF4870 domain-containing protein, partial [Prevotella sp.]|nr:DUF4870 domain-containing protein [Prevotella sp.]